MTRRGEIHAVDLEPVRGSKAKKRRPAVIVSNDAANLAAARLGRGAGLARQGAFESIRATIEWTAAAAVVTSVIENSVSVARTE